MAKRGRPRGLTINSTALLDLLQPREPECRTQLELCKVAGVSSGHLADMLHGRAKGASLAIVERMAMALNCHPATLAPELSDRFYSLRPGDVEGEAA